MSDINVKPFKILGIQQIAIGGEDKERLKNLWIDLLGFQFKSTFKYRISFCKQKIWSSGFRKI